MFIRMSFMTLLAYRANFINSLLSTLLWGCFLFVSMFLLTSQSPISYGFKQLELMLVVSVYSIIIGIFHTVFSSNFEKLSRKIRYGELDSLLMKPVDSQFFVSVGWVNITSVLRIVIGIVVSMYIIHLTGLTISLATLIVFIVLVSIGLVILYSLWMIVVTCLIWAPRASNLVQLMYSITGFSRFPKAMYQQFGFGFFLLFLPLSLVIFPSVNQLLQKLEPSDVGLAFFVALALLFMSRKFWNFSLRYYTSASS